ncbi:endolytic transglycosylase MltG [Metabacillus fastidiosus]|uniref:endolytic transglycosylase MltG n=1 Tax=Metabacillus fastidiosus TaxID=1458 RepID=UPI003D2C5219
MSKVGFQAFAAGMIVATSVMGASYFLENNQKSAEQSVQKEVTDAQVKNYLSKKGQLAISNEEYDDLKNQKEKLLIEQKNNQANKAEQNKEQPKEQEKKKYTLMIRKGMSTSDVSNLLQANGIIASSKDFNQFLIKGNYHTKVQLGDFEVVQGMNFQQITAIITKNK